MLTWEFGNCDCNTNEKGKPWILVGIGRGNEMGWTPAIFQITFMLPAKFPELPGFRAISSVRGIS
jgi:hypothetical protein